MQISKLTLALAGAGFIAASGFTPVADSAGDWFDPVLQPGAFCGGNTAGPPALLRTLILAKTETSPFQPVPPKPALGETPVLYQGLGRLHFPVSSKTPRVQAWFDQGMIFAFGFNHAEAQRAFREAQKLDPSCAICFWAEALVLGPNINVPMMPGANEPALAALSRAVELAPRASDKERALIAALQKRYSADPKAERPALDQAYADAMKALAANYERDDNIQALFAEAVMDTQPSGPFPAPSV